MINSINAGCNNKIKQNSYKQNQSCQRNFPKGQTDNSSLVKFTGSFHDLFCGFGAKNLEVLGGEVEKLHQQIARLTRELKNKERELTKTSGLLARAEDRLGASGDRIRKLEEANRTLVDTILSLEKKIAEIAEKKPEPRFKIKPVNPDTLTDSKELSIIINRLFKNLDTTKKTLVKYLTSSSSEGYEDFAQGQIAKYCEDLALLRKGVYWQRLKPETPEDTGKIKEVLPYPYIPWSVLCLVRLEDFKSFNYSKDKDFMLKVKEKFADLLVSLHKKYQSSSNLSPEDDVVKEIANAVDELF